MRVLSGALALIMALFVAVQYNDPDALVWVLYYGVTGLWCAIAALRPGALARQPLRGALFATLFAAFLGVVWYWPHTPGWWRSAVWWETETAREGMGMMIVLAALLAVTASLRRR